MQNTRKTVLIAVRKEYRRFGLRMCWSFEQRGLGTRLVTDVPRLLAEEREVSPEVIILDAAIAEPRSTEVVASLKDRPGDRPIKLILIDLPQREESAVRERWPDVEIIV